MNNEIKKKIASLTLAGTLAATPVISNANIETNNNIDISMKEYYEYLMMVKNADMSLYDSEFIEYFRNGKIYINGIIYSISSLYILECEKDGKKEIMLLCNNNINYDILSGKSYKGYKKNNMKSFRDTLVFFNLFQIYKDVINNNILIIDDLYYREFLNMIEQFDNTLHDKAPETVNCK